MINEFLLNILEIFRSTTIKSNSRMIMKNCGSPDSIMKNYMERERKTN